MGVRTLCLSHQQFQVVVRTHRVPEQQTLDEIAAELLQEVELRFVLDAFSDNVHIEVPAHLNDRVDDRRVVRVRDNVPDERLVDLERADRELLQCTQR